MIPHHCAKFCWPACFGMKSDISVQEFQVPWHNLEDSMALTLKIIEKQGGSNPDKIINKDYTIFFFFFFFFFFYIYKDLVLPN